MSSRFHFHEFAMDLAFAGGAKKIALLGCAIVVVATDSAAAVGGERDSPSAAFGEAVEMAVEHGHEVKVPEAIEEIVGVQRAHRHNDAERKVGEDDRGPGRIQLAEIIVKPAERGWLNLRILITRSVARIQTDELPAAVFEMVIQASRKGLVPGGTVGVGNVIVVPYHSVKGHAQRAQRVTHLPKFRLGAMFRQITDHQAEFRFAGLRADAGGNPLEPGRASRTLKVRVVDDREAECAGGARARPTGASRPNSQREHRTRAQAKPLSTCDAGIWSILHCVHRGGSTRWQASQIFFNKSFQILRGSACVFWLASRASGR